MIRERWSHLGGVVLGLLVAAAATYQPVGAAPHRLGTDVRMSAAPTGELDVSPRGPFLVADGLPAGHPAGGRVSVRNQTGSTLLVAAVVDAPLSPFADQLRVRVLADAETVAEGGLAALAAGSRSWAMEPGRPVEVTVEAWVAPNDGFGGIIDVAIRFTTTAASS